MKVKFNTTAAGPDGNWHQGETYEVKDQFGWQLVKGGYATRVDAHPAEEPEIETATADPIVEKASLKRGKK